MNKTMRIKLIIDIIMTVLMLYAMAYQLTGNMAHEVIGANLILFIAGPATKITNLGLLKLCSDLTGLLFILNL